MQREQHQDSPSPPSPTGRWWWVLLVVVVVAVVAGVLLVTAVTMPVGSQHDSDELGGDYCAYFPEDC